MSETIVQIYVPATSNAPPATGYYPCNLNGRYHARLVNITWADKSLAADNRLITIQSNCFRMPYGAFAQTILFNSRVDGEHRFQGPFCFDLEAAGNTLDLTISSSKAYDNTANNAFQFCILSLAVTPAK
jgi:hypothetical protein